jgi:hypothetical protein
VTREPTWRPAGAAVRGRDARWLPPLSPAERARRGAHHSAAAFGARRKLLLTPAPAHPHCAPSVPPTRRSPAPTGTPTPSASFATSATPSASGTPLPLGAFKEILVADCNGGVHILPGTPFEINLNLRGVRHLLNAGADEIRDAAKCLGRQRNW